MANELLNIRVPPVELEALRVAAAANGKTLQREALDRLKRSLSSEPQNEWEAITSSLVYLFENIANGAIITTDPSDKAEFFGTIKETICRVLDNLGAEAGAANTLAVDHLASQAILELRQASRGEPPILAKIRQALGTGGDLKAKGSAPAEG